MRRLDSKELTYEHMVDTFEDHLSAYDTRRRVETLVDRFLGPSKVLGRSVLDVGCGLGYFSKRLVDMGGQVTACDLGQELVRRTAEYAACETVIADAMALASQFGDESFEVVVSSECIEHTPDPHEAIRQMARVLKPGGYLAISTPNLLWWPAVRFATAVKLRPFDGIENFLSWSAFRRTLRGQGIYILEERGLHLYPFQLGCHSLSAWLDSNCQGLRPLMINMCVLGRKQA